MPGYSASRLSTTCLTVEPETSTRSLPPVSGCISDGMNTRAKCAYPAPFPMASTMVAGFIGSFVM